MFSIYVVDQTADTVLNVFIYIESKLSRNSKFAFIILLSLIDKPGNIIKVVLKHNLFIFYTFYKRFDCFCNISYKKWILPCIKKVLIKYSLIKYAFNINMHFFN